VQKRSVSWVSWPQNLDGTSTTRIVEFYVVNDFSQVGLYHNKSEVIWQEAESLSPVNTQRAAPRFYSPGGSRQFAIACNG